ncbi:MAG TPA: hypothetical protein VKD72_09905, partial [Gemmataceae bacterium]|nr:hypothetical protein [Gemmataceae bacterium]
WQDEAALPLDRPGDQAYEIAVADIEAAEPLDEQVDEPILSEDEAPLLLEVPPLECPRPGLGAWLREQASRVSRAQWLAAAGIAAALLVLLVIILLLR